MSSRWTRPTTRCRASATARCGPTARPAGFTFDVKAFSLLTQHPTKTTALPKALRPDDAKARVYLKDLPASTVDDVWDRFLRALAPLHDAGKLGAILLQFPQWFPGGKTNRQYILECAERCKPYRVSVEFRNRSWMDPNARSRRWISLRGYGFPTSASTCRRASPSSIPPDRRCDR